MARIIDADVLVDYVTELYEYDLCHADTDDYTDGRASAEHFILEKIRELPTIDAIPVEWLKTQINEALDDNETELASDIGWLIRKYINEQEAR